jgi:hypothetical protein
MTGHTLYRAYLYPPVVAEARDNCSSIFCCFSVSTGAMIVERVRTGKPSSSMSSHVIYDGLVSDPAVDSAH